ncbi:unnamed protein product [Calypogeia fissa]
MGHSPLKSSFSGVLGRAAPVPLLFVMSTQPLMHFLTRRLLLGQLQGIPVSAQLTVSFRLFADDLGIFIPGSELAFVQLRDALALYELATGARLNLGKTTIISLAMSSIPPWLLASGGHISREGEVHKYLGAPIGWNLHPSSLHNFCLDHIGERLATWSSQMLSFTGRVLLIKHVLQAIPIYHAMLLSAPLSVCTKIARLCKDFLWGFNKDGGRKLPLVAWEKLALPKIHGGLGFKDIFHHSGALLSRWLLKALDDPTSEWALLLAANLQMFWWINHRLLKKYCYNLTDRLLLGRPCGFSRLTYTDALWKPWSKLRENLILAEDSPLPGRWMIEDLLKVLPGFQALSLADSRVLAACIGRLGVHTVQDLWSLRDRRWRSFNDQLLHIRGLAPRFRAWTTLFLHTVSARQLHLDPSLPPARCWPWTSREGPLESFSLPNGFIYRLLLPIRNDIPRLNQIWQCSMTPTDWQSLWSTLWASDLSTRLKVFFWRVISQGFYTQKKAAQIGRDTPFCHMCPLEIEDLPHIFQSCTFAKATWRTFYPWLHIGNRRGNIHLLESLQHLSRKEPDQTARLTLFAQVTYSLWLMRCKQVHDGTSRFIATEVPLRAAEDTLRAQSVVLPPGRKYVRLIMAKQLIARWRMALTLSLRDPHLLAIP